MRTDVRRRMLADWLDFRRRPPTPARLLHRHARGIAAAFSVVAAAIAFFAVSRDAYWTGGAIGFGFAALLQLVQQFRVASIGWPVAAEFLDWARIEQAADDAGIDARPADAGVVE